MSWQPHRSALGKTAKRPKQQLGQVMSVKATLMSLSPEPWKVRLGLSEMNKLRRDGDDAFVVETGALYVSGPGTHNVERLGWP